MFTCPFISWVSVPCDPSFSTRSMQANSSSNEPGMSLSSSSSSNELLKDKTLPITQNLKTIQISAYRQLVTYALLLMFLHVYGFFFQHHKELHIPSMAKLEAEVDVQWAACAISLTYCVQCD